MSIICLCRPLLCTRKNVQRGSPLSLFPTSPIWTNALLYVCMPVYRECSFWTAQRYQCICCDAFDVCLFEHVESLWEIICLTCCLCLLKQYPKTQALNQCFSNCGIGTIGIDKSLVSAPFILICIYVLFDLWWSINNKLILNNTKWVSHVQVQFSQRCIVNKSYAQLQHFPTVIKHFWCHFP